MDKFILIDGNSLINRAFYATPILTNAKGQPTNAVYAFVNMLVKIIEDIKPKYMLVAFDRKESTFRHNLYPEYKGTRKPMPDDLVPQIDILKSVLDAIGIARYEQAGIEADDIIGTLAKKFSVDTIIYTGDKDSFQLVDSTTSVYFTKRGISDIDEYNCYNFVEKMTIMPKQIIDLKALMGDSSDNIPGVKGVGEKTALSLIREYASIENLYENIHLISGKLKDKLIESKETAFLSKTLATIDTSVQIPIALEDLTFSYPFSAGVKEKFIELEFKNLLKRKDIFEGDLPLQADIEERQIAIEEITSANKITSIVKNGKISLNISNNISFYTYENTEYILRIKENFFDEGFDFDEAVLALKPIFENAENRVLVYGKKQLMHLLKEYGISVKCIFDDLLLIKYLVDFSGKEESVEDILTFYNLDEKKPAYSISKLFDELYKKATSKELDIYKNIELPLSDVLYKMEIEGFKVDKANMQVMAKEYEDRCISLVNQIQEYAGEKININSSKQLSTVLFEKLGLKHGKKLKTGGYSTDSEILETLKEEHPIIPLILEYRKNAKILSTYIEGFKPLIDKNGLIHTVFYQAQTSTGRLSSRKPNLQNIPIRDDLGKEVRKLFLAKSDDRVLIDADYSQIELRLMADFSGCKPLIKAFNEGQDIHAQTASDVFGLPLKDVTPQMRRDAKAVNFGIIYGISDFGLSENLGISPKKAGEYIKSYFEKYPEIKAYMDKNVQFAKEKGYATTIFGRRRYIREINASNYNLRAFGERVAMNMPLQGSAADIMKIAMINLQKALDENNLKSRLILQVHDEIVVDAYLNEKEIVEKLIKDSMENAVKLSVPLSVEVKSSYNWFDCK